jgi:aryl-alcohol dehydrogenase-like predicted oxidoreductase
MLRFTLSNPDLDTTIVGTKNVEHLRQNVDAATRGALPADIVAEAKRRLALAGSMPLPNA